MKTLCLTLILIGSACTLYANSFTDTTFINKRFLALDFFNHEFNNVSFENCTITESNIDSTIWENIIMRGCFLLNSEYIRNTSFKDVLIVDGLIKDFSLYDNQLQNVYIEESQINSFELIDCHINQLIIRNSSSSKIRIQNSVIMDLKIIGGWVGQIEFINNTINQLELGYLNYDNIVFKAGDASHVKLINIISNDYSSVKFIETNISYPRFRNIDISRIDLTRANFDFKTFQLLDDYEADNSIYSPNKAKSIYLEARDTYYLIQMQFQNAGLKKTQLSFEFLMQEAYFKSKSNSLLSFISLIWEKYMRGHYGLSPLIVLFSAFIIWLVFSFIYILIGQITNVAWALYLPLNIHGNAINKVNPRFLNHPQWNLSLLYINYCMIFSLQQLLLPSFSRSGISKFRGIGFSQRLLIPIGIGKMLAFVQNALGIILLFNFVQAFIRVL